MAQIQCITTQSNKMKLADTVANVNGYLVKIPTEEIYLPNPPNTPDQLYSQTLLFLEVWHEDVSEKDVVFPYGQ